MKITHVVPSLLKGGAERVVVDLANEAVARGHSVTIITGMDVPRKTIADQLRPEIDVRSVVRVSIWSPLSYFALAPWFVSNWKWLQSQDIIHCHCTFASTFAAIFQALRGSRPKPAVIETYHVVGRAVSERRRRFHAELMRGRDAVAFVSEDPFWTQYAASDRTGLFKVIPNGVTPPARANPADVDRFRTERTRLPAGGHQVIGCIGRLVGEKRPDLIIETFAHLSRRMESEVHLLLCGEGPARRRLEEQVRRHGLQARVHMPGLILNPAEPFALIDLYVAVNVGSTTGIAAIEAASLGLPVIGAQRQEGYEAKPKDWIWSSADPEEVASRASELLKNPSELEMLARSQQAYARAHHSADIMADDYCDLYKQALARRTRGVSHEQPQEMNCAGQ